MQCLSGHHSGMCKGQKPDEIHWLYVGQYTSSFPSCETLQCGLDKICLELPQCVRFLLQAAQLNFNLKPTQLIPSLLLS